MTLRKGLPAKLAATDANDTRYDFNNNVVCNADGSPRGGVTSPAGVNLVTASATMNVSVAVFNGAAVRDGGVVLLSNDGPTNVLLGAAPPANSRIDVIYAKQNDASSTVTTPDANNNAVLGVVAGTASASPVKPALPVGALELATVLVPSTATATNSSGVVITQTAQYTAAPGGAVPFRTLALLNLWTNPTPNQKANVFNDTTTPTNNRDYFWDATASLWRPQYPWYREYTLARASVTDGTTFFLVATETTANATVNSFTVTNTSGTNGLLVLEAGLYQITASAHMGAPTSGTSLVQVRNFTSGGPIVGRASVALPADPHAQASTLFRANGTDAIIVEVQKVTGGATSITGALRIAKIGQL